MSHIVSKICAELLHRALEPRGGHSCKLCQPAGKTTLELRSSTLGAGRCYFLCHNAMLIQDWVITIVGGTSNGGGTLSWDPEVTWNIKEYNNSLTDTQFYILMIFHRCEDVNYCRRKCRRSWQLHIWVIWLSRNCDWRWVGGDGSHSSFWIDDGSLYEFVWTKLSSRCIKHFPTFFLSLNSLVQLPATAHSSKAATLEGPDPTDPLHTTPLPRCNAMLAVLRSMLYFWVFRDQYG